MPTYEDGQGMQITPRGVSLARTVNGSLSASVEITLHVDTTFLRCYATTQDVYLRWGLEDANSSLFDEIIPAGQVVDLAVPDGFTTFNVIERASSAAIVIIEK